MKRIVLGILAFENGFMILNIKNTTFLNIDIVTNIGYNINITDTGYKFGYIRGD